MRKMAILIGALFLFLITPLEAVAEEKLTDLEVQVQELQEKAANLKEQALYSSQNAERAQTRREAVRWALRTQQSYDQLQEIRTRMDWLLVDIESSEAG